MGEFRELSQHPLKHVERLRVDPMLFEPVFASHCSMNNCNAQCCREGVFLDPADRDKILQHASLIKKYLEPHQPQDERVWFDEEKEVDADFPSGYAVGTRKMDYGCVFLDRKGWCVLQKTAVEEGMHKWALKPFFCVAYPMTVQDGVLTVDYPEFTRRTECCSRVAHGEHKPIDICSEELEHMLGRDGFAELKGCAPL